MCIQIQRNTEVIPLEQRKLVSSRYHRVTRAINKFFWSTDSDTSHSLYVGSYGRGTAISTSDFDILFELPQSEFARYSRYTSNGQSQLLQDVRAALKGTFSRTDIRGDGQVVSINFADGMKFEILPAFQDTASNGMRSYKYPDTHMGGKWLSTDPKAEQQAMHAKNTGSHGLLFDTCKAFRRVRDEIFASYHLGGIVIDSFVYQAIKNWQWLESGASSSVENPIADYLRNLHAAYNQLTMDCMFQILLAPGSYDVVDYEQDYAVLGKVINYLQNV